jgi:site-specific DNA-methyltransferase (adenine-specific)
MNKMNLILERAKNLAKESKTWADFSNALFDPFDGEIVRALPTQSEREAFRKTREYKEIRMLLQQKMNETGMIKGATPKKSGKFIVRLPRSLHAALEKEADTEGTSLNQLVLTKLAVQLYSLAGGRLASLIQAFGEVRDGYSADRVIADPQLDRRFLRRCRELGLSGTDYDLNWALMNERKKGNLSHLPKTKRYTVSEIDEFEYASELAVRYLQQEKAVSLDQIVCDPDLASVFDGYASRLAPGFSPLQYRWVALGLRKAGRLGGEKEEVIGKTPELDPLGKVDTLRLGKIPDVGGLYLFSCEDERVFLGQTDNLRHRIDRHMEVSASHGLPDWLWDTKKKPLQISVAGLPEITKSVRQKMEVLLVKMWAPLLNLSRVA